MKKAEIIKATKVRAEEAGVKMTSKDVEAVTKALYDTIVEAVKSGETVKFNEVTYSIKEVPERTGTIMLGSNKGETWVKPAHKEIAVKASKALKALAE